MEGSVAKEPEDTGFDRLRLQFEEYADSSIAARTLAEKCRDYKDGKQLSEDERKKLAKRGQPPLVDNKIQDKCDTLSGIEETTRTDPKAFPRTPVHQEAAEAATDALRYIADDSLFQESSSAAHENLVVEGLCGGEVIVEKRKGRYASIRMNHIRWDRLFYDPHSLKLDYSDSEYKGFSTWMDVEQAKVDFGKNNKHASKEALDNLEISFTDTSSVGMADTHDDKPRYTMTARGRKRIQIFTHYFRRDGVWHYAVWCKGGYLEDPRPSPYKNEDGEPDCCIELQAVYKDRDGNPFGVVQRYLDLQDAHNKRHSKMLHLLNTKQIFTEKGALGEKGDLAKARAELHKPDGIVEFTPGMEWKVETNLDMAQGQFQLLQWTDAQLGATGPNDALQGQSGSISGRAKQLDQQAGTLLLGPLRKAHRAWKLRMYRHAWSRARQYWNSEMWIRVTDDEDKVRFVALNKPSTYGEIEAGKLAKKQMAPEEKAAAVEQIAGDPRAQQPMVENALAEMDVDIIIDEAPDTITVQAEQFETLAMLAEKRPEVPFGMLVELSQLRSDIKKRVADQISGANDPAAQQRQEMQQLVEKLQAALMAANVRDKNASASQKEAAAVESQVDASVKVATFTTGNEQAGAPAKPAGKTQVSVN